MAEIALQNLVTFYGNLHRDPLRPFFTQGLWLFPVEWGLSKATDGIIRRKNLRDVSKNDEFFGMLSDRFFQKETASTAFDQCKVLVHFIGSVDSEVDL